MPRATLKFDADGNAAGDGFTVKTIANCRIVFGQMPLEYMRPLTKGFSKDAKMDVTEAHRLDALFVLGEPQDLARGSYFGGRRPEDGRIDWWTSAQQIHNLVRAVAPPYPGAFSAFQGGTLRVLKTLVESRRSPRSAAPGLYAEGGRLYADCGDGRALRLIALEFDGNPLDAAGLVDRFGPDKLLFS